MTGELMISNWLIIYLTDAIVLKVNRMMEIAFENDLPLISLVQSVSTARYYGTASYSQNRPEFLYLNNFESSTREASSFVILLSARSTESHRVQSYSGLPPQVERIIPLCRITQSLLKTKPKLTLVVRLW
jgi:hypothetical protein